MDARQKKAREVLERMKESYAETRGDKSVPLPERVKKAESIHNIMKALEIEATSGPSGSDVIDRVSRPKKKKKKKEGAMLDDEEDEEEENA